jgi:hypothetical protein
MASKPQKEARRREADAAQRAGRIAKAKPNTTEPPADSPNPKINGSRFSRLLRTSYLAALEQYPFFKPWAEFFEEEINGLRKGWILLVLCLGVTSMLTWSKCWNYRESVDRPAIDQSSTAFENLRDTIKELKEQVYQLREHALGNPTKTPIEKLMGFELATNWVTMILTNTVTITNREPPLDLAPRLLSFAQQEKLKADIQGTTPFPIKVLCQKNDEESLYLARTVCEILSGCGFTPFLYSVNWPQDAPLGIIGVAANMPIEGVVINPRFALFEKIIRDIKTDDSNLQIAITKEVPFGDMVFIVGPQINRQK